MAKAPVEFERQRVIGGGRLVRPACYRVRLRGRLVGALHRMEDKRWRVHVCSDAGFSANVEAMVFALSGRYERARVVRQAMGWFLRDE